MFLKRITDSSDPMYHETLKLYQTSFPYHEQREPRSQKEILNDSEYHFCLIYDGNTFIGLILYWETEQFTYIEHFCILPQMRNRQYGQKTLALLTGTDKTLILEIDPPKDAISERRKGFYERCGFTENSFDHIHPPYHKENEGHSLIIMTCPKQIPQDIFEAFREYLENKVMQNVFS